MLCVYEFEVFEEEGAYAVVPFNFEGATQGYSIAEAAEMAADWLRVTLNAMILDGEELPAATFGNELRYGGDRIIVAIEAGLDSIKRVTAAEAARKLGVTRGRVSQMVKAGELETFDYEGRTWVTVDSVEARLAEAPKAGRPRKEALA